MKPLIEDRRRQNFAMRFYVYGLSEEVSETTLAGCAGVGGGSPFLFEKDGMRAVVSEFKEERVAVTRENLKAHNRVLGSVLAETTPLPFRFGTLASAGTLAQYIEAHRTQLDAALARVRGCVEMSVKILWETGDVKAADLKRAAAREAGQAAARPTTGAAYLAAKRAEMAADEELKKREEEVAVWLSGALGEAVKESRVEVRHGQALVVRAAHLVERARLGEYRERVREARARGRGELSFLTSGAWPPYSFSELSS